MEGAVVLHRTAPTSATLHDTSPPRQADPPAGETADLPGALLRDPLSDPDGWMNPNFDDSKWPNALEYLDQRSGHHGCSRRLALSGRLHGSALYLDMQPCVRQR